MQNRTTWILTGAAGAFIAVCLMAGTTNFKSKVIVQSSAAEPTCASSTGDGYICAEDGLESDGTLDVAGNAAIVGTFGLTGDMDLGGGAGALEFTATSSSVLIKDNVAAGLDIGAAGATSMLRFDSQDGAEQLITAVNLDVTGATITESAAEDTTIAIRHTLNDTGAPDASEVFYGILVDITTTDITGWGAASTYLMDLQDTTTTKFSVLASGDTAIAGTLGVTGITTPSGGIDMGTAVLTGRLEMMRFCGNGANGSTAWYLGPVNTEAINDNGTDMTFKATGCDDNDNATEGTADAPFHEAFIIKPVAMTCVIEDTAGTDTATFQLRTATADVSGMACTTGALDGSGFNQCTVTDITPVSIAAGATVAVKTTMSGSVDLSAAGVECRVSYTF